MFKRQSRQKNSRTKKTGPAQMPRRISVRRLESRRKTIWFLITRLAIIDPFCFATRRREVSRRSLQTPKLILRYIISLSAHSNPGELILTIIIHNQRVDTIDIEPVGHAKDQEAAERLDDGSTRCSRSYERPSHAAGTRASFCPHGFTS